MIKINIDIVNGHFDTEAPVTELLESVYYVPYGSYFGDLKYCYALKDNFEGSIIPNDGYTEPCYWNPNYPSEYAHKMILEDMTFTAIFNAEVLPDPNPDIP